MKPIFIPTLEPQFQNLRNFQALNLPVDDSTLCSIFKSGFRGAISLH